MTKRFLAFALAFTMLFSSVPTQAFATELAGEEIIVATDETTPDVAGETVPDATGESIPEATGETIPEATGEDIPEATEETAPEVAAP